MRRMTIGILVSLLVCVLCFISCSSRSSQNTSVSQSNPSAPNLTLVNRTPFQAVITLTSKKDNSEIKYEIEPGAEKEVFLNEGAYELMTLYSDHGRKQSTISGAIFHEGQEKWIFEQGQRVQQVPLTTASPAQQPTMSEATENPSTKGNAEPGDPKLTYALVVKTRL